MAFTDMMSSGRGPGVIGMGMALVVLLGFGLLFMFALDEGGDTGVRIETVIKHQATDITQTKAAILEGEAQLAAIPGLEAIEKKLSKAVGVTRSQQERIEVLKGRVDALKAEIVAGEEAHVAYMDEYRSFVRDGAEDTKMESLETRDGAVYKKVTVRSVSAVGMQIRHEGGLKRIAFEQLSDEMQDYYQFDPDQKKQAIAREAEVRKAHEASVAAAHEKVGDKAALERELRRQAGQDEAKRMLATRKSQVRGMEKSIRNLEKAIAVEKYKSISNEPQMRQQLAAKKSQLAKMRAEVSRLSQSL